MSLKTMPSMPEQKPNPRTERRIGIIRISEYKIEQDYGDMVEMLHWLGFIPVRAERLYEGDVIEMMGLSYRFSPLGKDDIARVYQIITCKDKEGVVTFSIK